MPFALPTLHDLFKFASLSFLFSTSSQPVANIFGDHEYIAPGASDVRSPCPALNALANHGFIARSGKDIGAAELVETLRSVYNLSTPLASTLVSGGMLCCGDILTGINLDALAAHNKIEHDASLVHDNALPGARFAPIPVNQTLLSDLLSKHPNGLSLNDLARARYEREETLPKKRLDPFHEEVGHGEAALTWLLLKDPATDIVPVESLKAFYGIETFPESYAVPTEELSFARVMPVSAAVAKAMKALRDGESP